MPENNCNCIVLLAEYFTQQRNYLEEEEKLHIIQTLSASCYGEPKYIHDGNRYCVIHSPGNTKNNEFTEAVKSKLLAGDYNFCAAYFPDDYSFQDYKFNGELNFDHAIFNGEIDFSLVSLAKEATFKNTTFCKVSYFSGATVSEKIHFPMAKFKERALFTAVKFHNDAGFCETNFTKEVNFSDSTFHKNADFRSTSFCQSASFSATTFNGKADFSSATFDGAADLRFPTFNDETYFSSVAFNDEVVFLEATFKSDVDFIDTTFSGLTIFDACSFSKSVKFTQAYVKDYLKFKCGTEDFFLNDASLDLDSVRIEKPERLLFHSIKLRPHWFINTDPRKFEFIDVQWDDRLAREREVSQSDRLLSIAYRQLAVNAEENNRYDEAMKFRYASMETSLFNLQKKWREDWLRKRLGNCSVETFSWWWEYAAIRKLFSMNWWYRTLSSYGESPTRAVIVLLLILFLSAVPYQFVGFAPSKYPEDKIGTPFSSVAKSLVYSLETASLQKPEPRPVTTMARVFVGLETILAPLQAALLALAIRRKYMR